MMKKEAPQEDTSIRKTRSGKPLASEVLLPAPKRVKMEADAGEENPLSAPAMMPDMKKESEEIKVIEEISTIKPTSAVPIVNGGAAEFVPAQRLSDKFGDE